MWSLGCTLFEMIERIHPFYKQEDQDGLINCIRHAVLPELSEIWKNSTNSHRSVLNDLLFGGLLLKD
jgi:hypothetical protein